LLGLPGKLPHLCQDILGTVDEGAAAATQLRHGLRDGAPGPTLSLRRFAPRLNTHQKDQPIRIEEGDPNGLEDSEDRRTAGRSGNQHVRLRGAQVRIGAIHSAAEASASAVILADDSGQ
jgi:hypothetical protein